MRISDWSSDVCSSDLLRRANGEIGHVERSRHAVDQADAEEEQERRSEVDDDVVHAGSDAGNPRAMQGQAVGCRQHDLEEDEQVEQVAGEEGAVQPHQQKLEQRMVVDAGAVPACQGKDERGDGKDARQHQHERRQLVQHENDAEGRWPVTQQIDVRRAVEAGRSEEHTSELQSLMRTSYAVFCLKKKKTTDKNT